MYNTKRMPEYKKIVVDNRRDCKIEALLNELR